MNLDRIADLLEQFRSLKIAVVGDFFLDKYLMLDERLDEPSLETGLTAFQVVQVRTAPGAAGTVAANLSSLGVTVLALGVTGDDGDGLELMRELTSLGIDGSRIIARGDLFTPTYIKPMLCTRQGAERELNRLDIKNRQPLPKEVSAEMILQLEQVAPQVDGVVAVDQVEDASGVVTAQVREALLRLAFANPRHSYAAESRARIGMFAGMILFSNEREALAASGAVTGDEAAIRRAAISLHRLARRPVFITRGGRGMLLCDEDGLAEIGAVPVDGPLDTVGAGDSALAGIVAALGTHATPREAAEIGNLVASVTIRQIGKTGTASPEQVLEAARFACSNSTHSPKRNA